jgi:hypothetical protein
MQPSWRVIFLIVAAGTALHVPIWMTALTCGGYALLEALDRSIERNARQRERDAIHEDEIYGWKPDLEELEMKGDISRVKLHGDSQIIVTRIAQVLRRMPS